MNDKINAARLAFINANAAHSNAQGAYVDRPCAATLAAVKAAAINVRKAVRDLDAAEYDLPKFR